LREKVVAAGGVQVDTFAIGKCFACLQVTFSLSFVTLDFIFISIHARRRWQQEALRAADVPPSFSSRQNLHLRRKQCGVQIKKRS
jgi:hypothetical protein